jgi:hypothetical protein
MVESPRLRTTDAGARPDMVGPLSRSSQSGLGPTRADDDTDDLVPRPAVAGQAPNLIKVPTAAGIAFLFLHLQASRDTPLHPVFSFNSSSLNT